MQHSVSTYSFIIATTSFSKIAARGCWKHQDLWY